MSCGNIGLLWSRSKSRWRFKMLVILSGCLLNHRSFCYQTSYGHAVSWARVSCRKVGSLSSMSRSQQGFIWSKYDYFYYIFWAAGQFATKLCLIILHHKAECSVEKLDHCALCQGPSEVSKCWSLFVWIYYESQHILLQNLVWWGSIMSQNFMQKKLFTIFKVKVIVRTRVIKIWLFLLYLLDCWFYGNQTWSDDTSS